MSDHQQHQQTLRALVAVSVAVLVLAGGVAAATIPAADGTITGCYLTANGRLRIVESAAACGPTERPLTWSQVGEPGPQGPAGPPGEDSVSFGDTVYGEMAHINGCADTDVVTMPVEVTAPARVHVSGSGSYETVDGELLSVELAAVLMDSSGSIVATTNRTTTFVPQTPEEPLRPVAASVGGFLKTGSMTTPPGTETFVAAPGSYRLLLLAAGSVGSCGGSPVLFNPTLTYHLTGLTS